MPNPDAYGTQGSIELLRQLVEYHGFYDRTTTQWKAVEDTTLLCAAAPASGGRHAMTPRFTWHLSTLCMPAPTHRTLSTVMTAILQVWVEGAGCKALAPSPVLAFAPSLVPAFARGGGSEPRFTPHVQYLWW